MKFDKHFPSERLKPYIKFFVVSENKLANKYKVFPSSGLVIGLQYKGKLMTIKDNTESKLTSAGITEIFIFAHLHYNLDAKAIKNVMSQSF